VWLACQAQPVNVIQALFLTDITNQARMVKTPTFYVFKLFKPHQKAKKIPITLQSENVVMDTSGTHFSYPAVSASASVDSTGATYITLSNCHLTAAKTITITLNTTAAYQQVAGQIITAPSMLSINDYGKAETVNIQQFDKANYTLSGKTLTVTLPSKSVVGLRLTTGTNTLTQSRPGFAGLSIERASGGKIVIHYSVVKNTPITLSLCGIDGRTAVRTFTGALAPESHRMAWQPGKDLSNGVYLLRIAMNGMVKTQQVVLAK
jgi:hypothetical protein